MIILIYALISFLLNSCQVTESKDNINHNVPQVDKIEDVALPKANSVDKKVVSDESHQQIEVKENALKEIKTPNTEPKVLHEDVEIVMEKHVEEAVESNVESQIEEEIHTDIEVESSANVDITSNAIINEEVVEEPILTKEVWLEGMDHSSFDAMCNTYISATGRVNYEDWKKKEGDLDAYLNLLSDNTPSNDWSKNEKLAYWINAYNAFTIKLILKNYPVSKITDLHGGKPWDEAWIKLGSKTYTLNNIENDIIRPTFNDPRIHFAVNCAANSCPPIQNFAFTGANLNDKLEKATTAFINNKSFNSISNGNVKISKIFDWYGGDFGDIIAYLNKYSNVQIQANAKVEFVEYDWTLNRD